MTGYELMSQAQRDEWDNLSERAQHRDTMRFTQLDARTLDEYEALAKRLETEHAKEQSTH